MAAGRRARSDACHPDTPAAPAAPAPSGHAGDDLRSAVRRAARLPPAGSGPVVYSSSPCFQKQGGFSVIEANTYLYYIQMKSHVSLPS